VLISENDIGFEKSISLSQKPNIIFLLFSFEGSFAKKSLNKSQLADELAILQEN